MVGRSRRPGAVNGVRYGEWPGRRQVPGNRAAAYLEMMKTIVYDLPGNSHADPADAGLGQAVGQMTSAEGDLLRALRTIIFKHDPGCKFGGLRCVLTPSGDFLWTRPEHGTEYDPGLPVLP